MPARLSMVANRISVCASLFAAHSCLSLHLYLGPHRLHIKPTHKTYLDGGDAAADDLARVAVLVNLAETSPLPELLAVVNLHQVDAALGAESLNQRDEVGVLAVGCEDAQVRLTSVKEKGRSSTAL